MRIWKYMEIYLEIFPTMPLLNKHKNQCELWFNKFLLRFLGCRNYSKFKESASDNRCCIFLFSNSVVTLQHCEILLSKRKWEPQFGMRVKFGGPWILISAGMVLQLCSSFTTRLDLSTGKMAFLRPFLKCHFFQ